MNKYLSWNSTPVPVLVQKKTAGKDRLHLFIAEIRVALSICRKFFSIVSNKLKASAVWIKYLTGDELTASHCGLTSPSTKLRANG